MSESDDSTSSTAHPPHNSNEEIDRTTLIEKARAFLLSPTVRHENDAAKRSFLEEKGLTSEEIDVLIRELPTLSKPPQPPPVPPRTYPQPPPSNLPIFLASLFRAFTWIAGVSGVLLIGYYRFLLPRLTQSLGARHRLKLHQSELLGRLKGRLGELKGTQEEIYDEVSQSQHEPLPAHVKSLADLPLDPTGEPTHPLGVVIRCAFLGMSEQRFTLEELCRRLLNQFPGSKKRHGEKEYKYFVFRELSRSRSFDQIEEDDVEYWTLHQDAASSLLPALTQPASSTQSLENLREAVSRGRRTTNSYQHTFKSLTDLTAFLSRETYALYGTGINFRTGLPGGHPLGPAEEDVRRDIRALKGLVLNRRTFAPSPYRPPSAGVSSTS